MKIYHCIPISGGHFQVELKASEPWLIMFSEFYQKVLNYSADRKQTCKIHVVKNIYGLCEHLLLLKQKKLFIQKNPVPYQISENKSTNHKAYNYMVTTTTTFVMKYMIVSKDPTQNNTVLFTWKPVKDYGEATLEIEYFVLDGEKVIAYKIISIFQWLIFLRSNRNDRYFAHIYCHSQIFKHLFRKLWVNNQWRTN